MAASAPEGMRPFNIRCRSRSMPTIIRHDHETPSSDPTRIEAIKNLRSSQGVWTEIQDKERNQTQESTTGHSPFVFPFDHLDPRILGTSSPYVFPFYKIDPGIFGEAALREKPAPDIFPFYKLGPGIFDHEAREERPRWESSDKFPLHRLAKMVGLEDVRQHFLSVRDRVRKAQINSKGDWVRSLNLDLIITGNRGTGKSTIAELYAEYLQFLGVATSVDTDLVYGSSVSSSDSSPSPSFYSSFSSDDSSSDDSDSSDSDSSNSYSMYDDDTAMDQNHVQHKVVIMDGDIRAYRLKSKRHIFVVVGRRKDVKRILSHRKAQKRFSRWMHLKDYSEDELFVALVDFLKKASLKVEGGFDAPFLHNFIRQIGYKRDLRGFENMRTLLKEIAKALHRRAERLEKTIARHGSIYTTIPYVSYRLTGPDFLGPDPIEFYDRSKAWKQLEKMAGMEKVKEAVRELVLWQRMSYARIKEGKKPLQTTLNRVFLGPPGTGKTTVAKLFGQIIADLGYIGNCEVSVKRATDFLGKYVGHSEALTTKILKETADKVLIIDEAHMFYHSSAYGTNGSDVFRKAIVDTIVANVDNEPGNGRCIILMGYPDQMKQFFQNTNPGFQRRFPLEDAFVFEDYDNESLGRILDIMLDNGAVAATEEARAVAMEVLKRERDRPNFGNGGAVQNLIARAKSAYVKRLYSQYRIMQGPDNVNGMPGEAAAMITLEPQDFDPEFDRGIRASKDFGTLLKDLVGFEDIISAFEGYQKMAANMRKRNRDPRGHIPFSFIFKGPPGTGKTTTARVLGQIYHAMGFLSTTEVLDCSATDLLGQYQGQTGPKVQSLLDRALGKVLFVDEAYRLGQRLGSGVVVSHYAIEALGELVDCMTKERYAHKLVIVLAGYGKDMDGLMAINEGLRGRFTEIVFPNMKPKDCLRLLQKRLIEEEIQILNPRKDGAKYRAIRLFEKLGETEGWANARDVETISRRVVERVFQQELCDAGHLEIPLEKVIAVMKQFLRERRLDEEISRPSEESD